MAKIDDLIKQVTDARLRRELQSAAADLRKRTRFGLVYEEHIPEMTALPGYPIGVGGYVVRREKLSTRHAYQVKSIKEQHATIEPVGGGDAQDVPLSDLIALQRFGEPVYPGLEKVGSVERGGASRPHHAVINAENYHAVQLLLHCYEGQVDCIYLDPPYNTGARDWTYNNDYVDQNDTWRHSKWLSMMERRLKLAKRLLRPDGVLIVTIDEHEVNHLGMLLEMLFPEYLRYMVTSVINPKGTFKQNFGRVDEQLFFVVPNLGSDVIVPRLANGSEEEPLLGVVSTLLQSAGLDEGAIRANQAFSRQDRQLLLRLLNEVENAQLDFEEQPEAASSADYEDWFLRRRGQESSYRTQRPNQFYAILVDEDQKKVVGIGPALAADDPYAVTREGSEVTVYPVDNEGHERVWRYSRETMQSYIDAGEIVVGTFNRKTGSWTLNHRKLKKDLKRHKTVWWEKSHDAGVHGTNVVNALLGERGAFPFPKSVYAVKDTLAAVVRNRPNALIVDFFAGSGTTFHATCLLNAEDGGQRRCVLVTNNEVTEEQAHRLHRHGHYKGDPDFERYGIFERVTKPRCEAVVTGRRPDGTVVPGNHINGRPLAQGFEENVSFFALTYLNPDRVDMGQQFAAIAPLLWLTAGGVGSWEDDAARGEPGYSFPPDTHYAVLFREARFEPFLDALTKRPDTTHAFLVTDSEEAYAEMRAALPRTTASRMLYRDYLRSFKIGTQASGGVQ